MIYCLHQPDLIRKVLPGRLYYFSFLISSFLFNIVLESNQYNNNLYIYICMLKWSLLAFNKFYDIES